MRLLRKIVFVVLLLIGGWWLLGKMDVLPSIGEIFRPKEVEIDQTPVIIQKIKPLAQLITITAYTEVAADTSRKTTIGERLRDVFNPFTLGVQTTNNLIIVGNAVIHAGVNLQKLTPEQLYISRDSVHLNLPPAEILDVIVNPSGTDIFLEEGKWDNKAIIALKGEIRRRAVEEVTRRGVLYQAEERARVVLQNFFLAAGFQKVVIEKRRLG
jgi:hypothetical protein